MPARLGVVARNFSREGCIATQTVLSGNRNTARGSSAWNALPIVTATEASLTGMLEPVANPIWVLLFLGERPSAFAIAGGVVVLPGPPGRTARE